MKIINYIIKDWKNGPLKYELAHFTESFLAVIALIICIYILAIITGNFEGN